MYGFPLFSKFMRLESRLKIATPHTCWENIVFFLFQHISFTYL